jgi:hypothetical protein
MSIYPKYLRQSHRRQASAATFAREIKPTLHNLVDPETGARRSVPIYNELNKYAIEYEGGPPRVNKFGTRLYNTVLVNKRSGIAPERVFVSDPDLFKRSVHITRDEKVPGFRLVRDGKPVLNSAGISKVFKHNNKGGKNRSHTKKSGRKTGRKTYKRRH